MRAIELFEKHLLPLYPRGIDLAEARGTDANPGNNPSVLAHLVEAAEIFTKNARALLDLELDFSDASVHRLSRALTKEARDAWIARGELARVIIHGAAWIGECVVRVHGGKWLVRRPLWESQVALSSRAGDAELAVLQWWVKSLADDSEATLADRYRALVEIPTARPEELPVIASPARTLPPITKKVTYDLLFKYLKAHVPELRDLGRDFPSPERFAEYRFQGLAFHWLGGGRMLLLSGVGEGGLHLLWLTAAGFEKSALVPCDPFPAPIVTLEGENLVCVTSRDQKIERHEWLWWGP